MISLPSRNNPDEFEAIFGPNWYSLTEFGKVVVEALAESDADFERLARDLTALALTPEAQLIADCMEQFNRWLHDNNRN
jgi:hypothetical protein